MPSRFAGIANAISTFLSRSALGGGQPIIVAQTLGTLSLSGILTSGSSSSGVILGSASGSTITSNVSGLTVNSANRSYAWDGTGLAGTTANGLVEALSGATGSPKSSPITVAAASAVVPAAPSLSVAPGTAQNVLSWTDGSNGGAAITSHKLYRSSVSGAEVLIGTIATGSPYTDTGLTNGTQYFYKLSAVNSVGEGPLSGEVSATPSSAAVLNAVKTTSGLATVMAAQSLTAFASGTGSGKQITIDPSTTYQPFQGVGCALTGSAAYCLMNYLTSAQRTALLTEMFGTNGFSYIRLSIGSSDFTATGNYTYDETAGDTSLTNFALSSADTGAIIPILQQILAINPNVRVIAAPWTPPTWMKTGASGTNSFSGGSFSATTANLTTYAQYFVKYVQAMASYGIPIFALSPQNEPVTGPSYPSCAWSTSDMVNFINNYMRPALTAASISCKIWIGDDSWSASGSAAVAPSMLASGSAGPNVDGMAWHGYRGAPSVMTTTHNSYPTKTMQMTEHRTLFSQSGDDSIAQVAGTDIIQVFQNWCETCIFWNLALDQNGAPAPESTGRRGVVTIKNDSSGTITRNTEYYALAHLAKYVQRGALRIASTSPASGPSGTDIETVAFKNPDGSTVVFLWNGSTSDISISLVDAVTGKQTTFTATARAMMTVQYSGLTGGAETALAISGQPAASGTIGTAYDFLPTVTGGSGTRTFALTGSLPAGLSFSTSTGEISGTPTAAASATGLNISVTDSTGTVSLGAFSITTYAAIAITNAAPSGATVGTAYSFTPSVSGGTGTYSSFRLDGTLPTGLSFNTSTGAITGTPSASGSFPNLFITVTDSAGNTGSTPFFNITVSAAAGAALSVSGTPASTGQVGTAYDFVPTISGGTSPYTAALTGTLPAGLSFNTTTGEISGTPTAAGTATGLNITITDSAGASVSSGAFSIAVAAAAGGAALAQDAVSQNVLSSTALTMSWSHTLGASANLLVVAIMMGTPEKSGGVFVSYSPTLTCGGVAMTRLGSDGSTGAGNGHDRVVEFWYLVNPPTGAQTLAYAVNGATGVLAVNMMAEAVSYNNAITSGPFGTLVNTHTTGTSTTSLSVTPSGGSANGVIFAVNAIRSTTKPNLATGQTALISTPAGTNMWGTVTLQSGASGTTSFGWATADAGAVVAVPILSN